MRLIDADHMKEELLWGNVFLSAKEINALVDLIDNQPTLTPPNEPFTCEGCMYNGSDFMVCYGCARKMADYYRRPPEGEEDKMSDWIRVAEKLPPENKIVETRIDDGEYIRNEQQLKRRGNLWFLPDGSMYVYYTPTHWR